MYPREMHYWIVYSCEVHNLNAYHVDTHSPNTYFPHQITTLLKRKDEENLPSMNSQTHSSFHLTRYDYIESIEEKDTMRQALVETTAYHSPASGRSQA